MQTTYICVPLRSLSYLTGVGTLFSRGRSLFGAHVLLQRCSTSQLTLCAGSLLYLRKHIYRVAVVHTSACLCPQGFTILPKPSTSFSFFWLTQGLWVCLVAIKNGFSQYKLKFQPVRIIFASLFCLCHKMYVRNIGWCYLCNNNNHVLPWRLQFYLRNQVLSVGHLG